MHTSAAYILTFGNGFLILVYACEFSRIWVFLQVKTRIISGFGVRIEVVVCTTYRVSTIIDHTWHSFDEHYFYLYMWLHLMRSLRTNLFRDIQIADEDPLAYLGISNRMSSKNLKKKTICHFELASNPTSLKFRVRYSLLCVASHSGAGINMFNTSSFSASQGLHMGRFDIGAAGGSIRPKKERRPSAKVCSPSCLKEQPWFSKKSHSWDKQNHGF